MAKKVQAYIKLQVPAGQANPSPPVGPKTPPASVLLRKIAGIAKGSGRPNTEKVGKVSRAQLEEIATTKDPDLTAADMDAAVRTIAGTARSMGLEVEGV